MGFTPRVDTDTRGISFKMKTLLYPTSSGSQQGVSIIFFKNLGVVPLLQLCSEDFLTVEGAEIEESFGEISLSWTTSGSGLLCQEYWECLSGAEWGHLLEITYPPADLSSPDWATRLRKPLRLKLRNLTQTLYHKRAGALVEGPLLAEWGREVHHLLLAKTQWVLEKECSGGDWTLEQMVREFLRSQKLGTLGI